jgi:hypothetical protein
MFLRRWLKLIVGALIVLIGIMTNLAMVARLFLQQMSRIALII